METQVVVIFSLLLNAVMIIVVLYLVYKSDKVLTQFEPVVKEGEKMRQTITKKVNEILTKTIMLAQELVKSSVTQSQQNLKISDEFKAEMEAMMKQGVVQIMSESKEMIQNESTSILSGYQNQFSSLNEEVAASARDAKNEIISQSKARIDEIGTSIQQGLSQIPILIENKVEEQLAHNQKSMQEYTKQKMTEVDAKIYQLVKDVAKKAIGRSIDLAGHEELVLEALEKAKKEKLF